MFKEILFKLELTIFILKTKAQTLSKDNRGTVTIYKLQHHGVKTIHRTDFVQ